MKIIRLCVLLSVAFSALGGCASAHITKEDEELERESNKQLIDQNQNKIDRGCIANDAAAKANALKTVGADGKSPAELTGLQHRVYQQVYEELKPNCLKDKRGASSTGGGRYNVSAEELARMPLAMQCEYASSLMLMLMSNEVRNVDHMPADERSSIRYLKEVVWPHCDRRAQRIEQAREYELEQRRIEKRAEVEKYRVKRETPPFWARFIGPRHGYHGHSTVKVNAWYDRSGSRSYRGAPSDARRDLMEDAGYNRWGQHKNNGSNWWRKY